MQILRDHESIATVVDPVLRSLIEQRVEALAEFSDYDLADLATFLVVEAGESIAALDQALGFSVLERPFELIEGHHGYFEILFVVSDDGVGIEVFIPNAAGVDPDLLSFCVANVTSTKEEFD